MPRSLASIERLFCSLCLAKALAHSGLASAPGEHLFRAIRPAASRGIDMPPRVASQVATGLIEMRYQLASVGVAAPPRPAPTPRQREILKLSNKGFPNQEIAERLSIEAGTVKNCVHNEQHKLDVRDRIGA